MTQAHDLLDYMLAKGGHLTSLEATRAGFPRKALTRLVSSGQIERLERGVYRLSDERGLPPAFAEQLDLLKVQLRYPYARPTLVSALHLHGLSTTRPHRLQFALPANRQAITFAHLPLELFYFSPRFYGAGTLDLPVRGRTLSTYTPEKTLADLLRFAPRFGRELYLEGLKNYLRSDAADRSLLIRTARHLGVGAPLQRDLEVLSHDQGD
jgi:Transcriptional regulator, AbiEi antitoxin